MTEQATIDQMNEVIADFMQLEKEYQQYRYPFNTKTYLVNGYWTPVKKLKYHTDWNWITVPAKKIAEMIMNHKWENTIEVVEQWKLLSEGLVQVNIKKVHRGVYQFIQWLNKQQQ